MRGQRLLALCVEHALGCQPRAQFLERAPQRAFAGFFHVVQHQLVIATCLVQGEAPAREHAQPLARLELQPGALGLEHRAADLCTRILEREIQMAGGGAGHIAQFGLHPHQGETAFEQVARQRVELAGSEDLFGAVGHRRIIPQQGTQCVSG